MRRVRLDTISRIAIAVSGLAIMLLMLLDFAFKLVPDPAARERDRRQLASEVLAGYATQAASQHTVAEFSGLLEDALGRVPGLRSAGLRRDDGTLLAATTQHARLWKPLSPAGSTSNHVRVPIYAGGKDWGVMELAFAPVAADSFIGAMFTPAVLWVPIAFVALAAMLRLYLGRVLRQLDPAGQVPERIRNAYNALSESVLLLDGAGRIVMANDAFRTFVGGREIKSGGLLEDHAWFREAVDCDPSDVPWKAALQSNAVTEGFRMHLRCGDETKVAIVGCTPILDGGGKPRGCLVAFLDRTAIERAHEDLQQSMQDLRMAHEQIQQQNEHLTRLATRDPLTGCLNRRAFFDGAHPTYARHLHDRRPVACVMADIDHFKNFNDRHGHSVGDEVIKAVSALLGTGLRPDDLVCRYGGEEFLLLMPDCDERGAMQVAQRLCASIQRSAGESIQSTPGLRVTSSFGVAVSRTERVSLEHLIEQADQALYESKHNGRNRVTLHTAACAGAEPAAAQRAS